MNSPELRLFAEYNYLRELISSKKSASLQDLSLCNRDHTNIPPPSLLFYFSGLRSLAISHNQINRFSAADLLRGAPILEKLDFSYNNIATFEDLIELGSSKTLRSLNIIGNPIANQHARIQQIELLLFPNKYRSYNPVEVLTATYNLSSINVNAKKKCDIVINKVPGSSKSKRGQYILEEDHGKSAKLIQEMCPIPRKTRFAYLGIFNEEIISIRDIQNILVNKDISSILFEKKVNEGPTLVRSEKLHQRYVESYTRRKARGKEVIDVIPSLEKLSHMIRNNDNMELIYSQDRIRYDKLKLKKPDYEEELWKGPLDSQLQVQDVDFTVSIAQMKREAREYDEKKEARDAYKKEHPKAVKEYDRLNIETERKKTVWKKKQGTGREITSMNSLESSIPEHPSDHVKKTIGFSEDDESRKETEDIPEVSREKDLEEEEQSGEVMNSGPERVMLRHRSQSLPKFNKSRIKQVAFDNEEGVPEGEESIAATQVPLCRVRRTNSELVGTLSRNILTPSLTFDELKLKNVVVEKPKSASSKPEIQSTRRFVVVQDSAPNVGLPLFMNNNKKPGHKRSVSVQPVQRMANVPGRPESVSGDRLHVPIMPLGDIHQLSNLNLKDKDRRPNSHRNVSNSGNPEKFPSIDYSKIKEENSNEYPFFSSNQGFISMRSFELESKSKMDSDQKSNKKDSIIDSSKISFITPVESSRYRSGSASPYEIASTLVLLNQAVPNKRQFPNQDEIITSIIGRPKKLLEVFDKGSFGSEERGSRPNSSKSAADLYSEIQSSLVNQKITGTKQGLTGKSIQKNSEQGSGTLRISNVLGCFNSERGNRGQNKSPGATVQQQREKKRVLRNRGHELGTLSPHTSFLSSQLSKNNNHSLVHIRKLRGTTGNFTSRGGLEIQGEQLEEPISAISAILAGKRKTGPKEEIGLDSTKAFSAAGQSGRKLKSRSGSAENIISLNSVVSSGVVIDRRIRNIRLKQVL